VCTHTNNFMKFFQSTTYIPSLSTTSLLDTFSILGIRDKHCYKIANMRDQINEVFQLFGYQSQNNMFCWINRYIYITFTRDITPKECHTTAYWSNARDTQITVTSNSDHKMQYIMMCLDRRKKNLLLSYNSYKSIILIESKA